MASVEYVDVPTILFSVIAFMLLTWWLRQLKSGNLLPGPWGWPLLGYLPNFALMKYRSGLPVPHLFNSLAKKYGPVFSMNFAGNEVVVLNNLKYVKEAFNHPNLCDRPRPSLPKGEPISTCVCTKELFILLNILSKQILNS